MRTAFVMIALLSAACGRQERSVTVDPGARIDSIFPVEEEIRRFRLQRQSPTPAGLEGGAGSAAALAGLFIRAIETQDTAAVRALILDDAEFITFYYPNSPFARAPYKQSPETVWLLIRLESEKGIARAFQRFGGREHGFRGIQCQDDPVWQGKNVLHPGCVIRWRPGPGRPDPIRLFGTILQRDGRFKFVSFASDL